MTRAITIILFAAFFVAILLFLHPKWYWKNDKWKPDSKISARLYRLGDSALNTLDVPVAAVLLYDSSIIGEGYNTVKRNNTAGAHAEINAISDAMRKTGFDSFMHLDRNRLTLVTTLEPCYMCQGAIVEYSIQHVVMFKSKSLYHWFKQWRKMEKYELNKQVTPSDSIQMQLFRKHPYFQEQKVKNDF